MLVPRAAIGQPSRISTICPRRVGLSPPLLPETPVHLAGLPSPRGTYSLSPTRSNQSRSSYFRAIQPSPPVPHGPTARIIRDVSRRVFSMEFASGRTFCRASSWRQLPRGLSTPLDVTFMDTPSTFNGELCNRPDGTGNERWVEWKVNNRVKKRAFY